jgi:ubiquinone/menaquinone biosynthesis C-methylase UbiE
MRTTITTNPPLGNMAAVIEQLEAETRRAATPSLLDLAAPAPGETVIDLGCRVLADDFRAMRRVGAAGRVRGIVESRANLEHATALRDRWVFADLAYKCAPLAAVPLDDEVADIVIVDGALGPSDEPLRILEEAYRLLAPEGRLALGVTSEEASRLSSLLEVLGLEIRTMRDLGPGGRTVILATKR